MNTLFFKKLVPEAQMPGYATPGAACFDLVSVEDHVIIPGTQRAVKTGIAYEVPENHVMLVFSRSGQDFKSGVRLVNSVGVIDSDYRGEVMVGLRNDGSAEYVVKAGDRIAQAMLMPVERFVLWEVEELSETERGEGGLGSTGK